MINCETDAHHTVHSLYRLFHTELSGMFLLYNARLAIETH